MDLSNLKPAKGSVKKNRRLGRGQGSGRGGTSTRGHKGAKQRSGYKKKVGFEGGQMPLQRRVPKYGFKNVNRREYKGINLGVLQALAENNKIDKKTLDGVKLLAKGTIEFPVNIKVNMVSRAAKEKIETAGGTVEVI